MARYTYTSDDGRTVHIHHNSDFSGNATLTVTPPDYQETDSAPKLAPVSIEVPCAALIVFGRLND